MWHKTENEISPFESKFFNFGQKKHLLHSHIFVISDLMRFHYGRNRRNRGWKWWPKVTENQTNHFVATESNVAPSRRSVSQGAAQKTAREKKKKAHAITVVKNSKDVMKITVHGELNIYFSFHGV